MVPAVRTAGRFAPCRLLFIVSLCSLVCAVGVSAQPATLAGTIADPQGQPVPDVLVSVLGPLGASVVRTDADGRFEVTNLPPAAYRVLAELAGWRADPQTVRLEPGETREVRVPLALAGISESVVVSASHVEVSTADAPASVTVIDRSELRARQAEDLSGALAAVPGLTVSRNGGRGALTSVFPRGGESDYTLFLVDGIRLNAFGGGTDFSQIAIGNIDRIEIVRGPQSAVYGADAIGGVVQVVTAHGGPARGEALAEGGSEKTWRAAASGAGSRGRWSFGGSAERGASDGFTGTAPASGEMVSNDDLRQHQLTGSIGWQRSAETSARLHARSFESDRGFPGPYGSDPIGVFPGVDRVSRGRNDSYQVGASVTHPWGRRLAGRIRQRWTWTYADFDSDFTSPFGRSRFETRRAGLRAQTDVLATTNASLSAGVEIHGERARSTYITGQAGTEVPIERSVIGSFIEWRQQVTPALSLAGGLRVERIRLNALEPDPNAFDPRPAFPADTVVSTNPRVTLSWTPGERGVRLHASAGTGIRPPDAFEIAFTDNPGLKPERSRSIEAGLGWRLARALQIDATVFRNSYDDLIVAVGRSLEDASRYRTDNVSNARSAGLEVAADVRRAGWLAIRGTYTWLDTEILAVDRAGLAPPPFSAGDPLIRRPRHKGTLDLFVTTRRVIAFAQVGARGRTLDVEPNFGAFGGLFENAGYAFVNGGFTLRLPRTVDVFVRGLNLLDRRYEETLGFPALPRGVIAGVRVAVGR